MRGFSLHSPVLKYINNGTDTGTAKEKKLLVDMVVANHHCSGRFILPVHSGNARRFK